MTTRHLVFVLCAALMLFSACSLFTHPKEVSLPAKEAATLMRKAADLTGRNNYQQADRFYQDAWEQYNFLNDNRGRAIALLGRIKCNRQIGKQHIADSLANRIEDYARADKSLAAYSIECKISSAYFTKQPDALKFLPSISAEVSNPLQQLELKSSVYCTVLLVSYELGLPSEDGIVQAAAQILDSLSSLSLRGKLENEESPALLAYALGLNSLKKNDFTTGNKFAEMALAKDEDIENPRGIADDSYLLGVLSFRSNDFAAAGDRFLTAKEMYSAVNDSAMSTRSSLMKLLAKYKLSGSITVRGAIEKLRNEAKDKNIENILEKYLK